MRVFLSHAQEGSDLASILAKRLRERDYDVMDPSEIQGLGEVMSEITTEIRKADIVVVLITSQNPNIMFELGVARGANRTLLIASRDTSDLPFDITSVPHVSLGGVAEEDAVAIERRVEVLEPPQAPEPFAGANNLDMLQTIAEQPELASLVTPREFDGLLKEYFAASGAVVSEPKLEHGYDFEITIQGARGRPPQRFIVEAKRTLPNSRVSLDSVLRLAGAVEAAGADRGLLITTSDFTTSARGLAQRVPVSLLMLSEVLSSPTQVLLGEDIAELPHDPQQNSYSSIGSPRSIASYGAGEVVTGELRWARVASLDSVEPEVAELGVPRAIIEAVGGPAAVRSGLIVHLLGSPDAVGGVRVSLRIEPSRFSGEIFLLDRLGRQHPLEVKEQPHVAYADLPADALRPLHRSGLPTYELLLSLDVR